MKASPLWVALSVPAIRALPFGRYQLSNAIAKLATEPFVARLPRDLGGATFVCDLRDSIAREVCFTGRYEPQETQLAMRLLGPGMSVVDVGANWGYFTLVCAHLVGRRGRVVAIEPHPRLASMLDENVRANGLAQIEVLRLAAGAARGARTFVGFDEDGGNSGVSRAARASEVADFECPTAAIDSIAVGVDGSQARVDLVKMDIEGGEADALEGMASGLAARRYRFVLLECHPAELAQNGGSVARCLEPFERAGYSGWHVDHSAAMHRRAASGAVPVNELLTPIDSATIGRDPWPHFLFAAPGEPLPA
jgi:FkbM family methyltransferase